MKLIHVSDLHLTIPGVLIEDRDPHEYCRRMIDDINIHHPDANLVVISGDLANQGDLEAYHALKTMLENLTIPFKLMMGNHDDRTNFFACFPEQVMPSGFVQSSDFIDDAQIICLDTLQEGQVAGFLCDRRLEWLDYVLDKEKDLYLFLHHPSFPIGAPALDGVRLQNSHDLYAILAKHPRVQHIFAGHVHRPTSGIYNGICFSTVKSTCVQSALTFRGGFASNNEAPAYAIYLKENGSSVLHFHDFINGEAKI